MTRSITLEFADGTTTTGIDEAAARREVREYVRRRPHLTVDTSHAKIAVTAVTSEGARPSSVHDLFEACPPYATYEMVVRLRGPRRDALRALDELHDTLDDRCVTSALNYDARVTGG